MQARLYHSQLKFIFLMMLTTSSFLVFGTGCTSSESTEYREFSQQTDEGPQKNSADESQTTAAAQTLKQTALTSETKKQNTTALPTGSKTLPPTSEENSAKQSQPSQTAPPSVPNTEEKELALVARRPDPKERALTEREKKTNSASIEPREVKVLVKNRTFRKTSPENALRVSYDDIDLLKVLNMEPVTPNAPELMPEWLKKLDGARIRIRGFMFPPYQQTDIEAFQLARDNQICCFGKNPKIYDLFPVILRDGETTDYILNRPFDVVGTFHIKVETIDGELDGELGRIYMITDAIVIDK